MDTSHVSVGTAIYMITDRLTCRPQEKPRLSGVPVGSGMAGKAMAGRYSRKSAKCGRGQLSGDYCLSTL